MLYYTLEIQQRQGVSQPSTNKQLSAKQHSCCESKHGYHLQEPGTYYRRVSISLCFQLKRYGVKTPRDSHRRAIEVEPTNTSTDSATLRTLCVCVCVTVSVCMCMCVCCDINIPVYYRAPPNLPQKHYSPEKAPPLPRRASHAVQSVSRYYI